MKHSVWILNSSLLVLFFASQLLIFMMQRVIPRRISITPGVVEVVEDKKIDSIDISTIYTHDLFDTYQAPVVSVENIVEQIIPPIPQPPKIIIPDVPVEKSPIFFAPLDAVLKGVIFVKDDAASCIAIIQLKKTKEDKNYRVGDLIEDAQILKILSNRIIIIRSNGQQETLYLREEDAVSDFNIQMKTIPQSVVELVRDTQYKINVDKFSERIGNLGQFIQALDITTVYKQGKSFGCKIGNLDKDSLGSMLGFMADDVVVKVDDFFIDDLDNRLKLYDHIIQKHVGDIIEVVLYRGDLVMTLSYGLVDNVSQSITFTPQQTHQKLLEELRKHQAKVQAETEKSVKIQMISQEQLDQIDDQPIDNTSLSHQVGQSMVLSKEHTLPVQNPTMNYKDNEYNKDLSQKQSVQDYNLLLQERDKLTPTLQDLRSKDRARMMQQSSKNIIFNGMQQ
jgi:hypothetical protein